MISYEHVESGTRALAAKRGADWDSLIRSAEHTAAAHGRAYIVVTKSDGVSCGGKLYVTTDPDARAFGLPNVVLATITED